MKSEIATVWTLEGCNRCHEEIELLRADGCTVDVIVVDDMSKMDPDAFAQSQLQDGMFPVVKVDWEFRIPASILKKLKWEK